MATLSPAMSGFDAPEARPAPSLAVRFGKRIRPWVNALIARSSRVGDAPVLDAAAFAWTADLQAAWPVIRDEMRAALRHRDAIPPLREVSPDHRRIATDGKWKSFFLVGYGHRVAENIARCPRTAALVERIPDLNSAFFSVLDPGCHIPRHKGVTKGVVTCHLGLDIPARAEDCRMQVADRTVHWRAGEWLVFDDTYPHEVWNDTGETRVILLVQVERPAGWLGRLVTKLFLGGVRKTSFVRDVKRNLGDWDAAYRRAEQNELCSSAAEAGVMP